MKTIGRTYSVCPICLKRIHAQRVNRDGAIYLEKECREHGSFSTIIWRNFLDISEWTRHVKPIDDGENQNCPHACGICRDHRQDTCCILLEVTRRCNMACRYCFVNADKKEDPFKDPSLENIRSQISCFVKPGETLLQLSGGEPTIRNDLPLIVKAAKSSGCKYVQLNTNGIRLAEEEIFVKKLAEAGLSFVFLQFDGTSEIIYQKLRGRSLLSVKKRAVENCSKYGIGVTLVPTVVRNVNTHDIGNILKFAVSLSPDVRGVHFQPVSYMGKIAQLPEDRDRVTLDELMFFIYDQAGDLLRNTKLKPSCCDHPLCGFHGDFLVLENGTLYPLDRSDECRENHCDLTNPAAKNREFIGRRWNREKDRACCVKRNTKRQDKNDIHDMSYFLNRVKSHGFTVTAMAFQDVDNLDIERLRSCSLHVFRDDKLIPFCANYLTRRVES